MTTTTQVKLIGGPLSNRVVAVDDVTLGKVYEFGNEPKRSANVTVQTKHHYRLDPHPSEGFVLSWVNPADRRQYGR